MRALLMIALALAALHSPAQAEEQILVWGQIGLAAGSIKQETIADRYGDGRHDYSGQAIGASLRLSVMPFRSAYRGFVGGFLDADALFVGPNVTEGGNDEPAETPRLGKLFVNLSPGLALTMLRADKVTLELQVGLAFNTDLYGLSAETVLRIGRRLFGVNGLDKSDVGFHAGLRGRSGKGWENTKVLDVRGRAGLAIKSWFVGVEVLRGYSEDTMNRADLGQVLKGGYLMTMVTIGKGV